jgi:hypothetical protein
MAIDIRLNDKVSSFPQMREDTWQLVQEEINLWWGIVIRERYI